MRKVIILLLVLLMGINASYSATKLPKEKQEIFRTDMAKILNHIVNDKFCRGNLTAKEYILKMYSDDLRAYQEFLTDKNNMKKNYELAERYMSHSGSLQEFDHVFYDDIIELLETYQLSGQFPEYYLKKYKVPYTKEFNELVDMVYPYQTKILNFRKEVVDYSKKYENTKAQNFYIKNIASKSTNLDDFLGFNINPKLNTTTLYYSQSEVIQILPGGCLAQTMAGGGKLIYIQTNGYNSLHTGDLFMPYIPLKFTGQYKTYTTLYGNKNTVPIFREVLPAEFKKNMVYPKIGEQFYFIEKPEWTSSLKEVRLNNQYLMREIIFRKGY